MQFTDNDIKKLCSSTVISRAKEYFESGRVHIKTREDNLIAAYVDDDRRYNVRIDSNENGICDAFCTCAYFETMNSPCKHIAATLMQRIAEQNNAPVNNANEDLCRALINDYITEDNLPRLPLSFNICINHISQTACSTTVSLKIAGRDVENISGFLTAYSRGEYWDYRKKRIGTPPHYYIGSCDRLALDILAEFCENINSTGFVQRTAYLSLGSATFKRAFEAISDCSYNLIFNGVNLGKLPFLHENPDILIDITAKSDEICLYAANFGTAVVLDGSIFFYENNIYLTDSDWQSWFMPIYRALGYDCRSQLSFSRQNAIDFARNVLPKIVKKPGVITNGIENNVINLTPEFTLYLDTTPSYISCVVRVKYGDITFTLPTNNDINTKIVVRDKNAEDYILWQLSDFEFSDGKFRLYDEEMIFTFISKLLPQLRENANVILSEAIDNILPKEHSIKHNISYNEKIDLLESNIESDLSIEEIRGILAAIRLKKQYFRLPSGEFVDVDAQYNNISTIKGLYDNPEKDMTSVHHFGLMYLMGAIDSTGINVDKSAQKFIENLKNIKADIPPHLENTLRDYQKDGLNWMKQLSTIGQGGILADDMGLGKTLQAISYIYSEATGKPSIIICPSSLTYNWYNEIEKFTPAARAVVIDGSAAIRKSLIDTISDYDFVITSYALIRRDYTEYQNTDFSYCIIDEAQNIKNSKSLNSKSVKSLSADFKFALTGTPIENSLSELWSIFDFCNHGYLGEYGDFKAEFENLIMAGDIDALNALKKKIGPFVLRRMKSEVLDELPEKIENTVMVNMTEEQEKMYHSFRNIAKNRASALLKTKDGNMEILTLLLRLRQICCHPSVFDSAYNYGSAKLDLLLEIVENAIAGGHRILIFSQFTSMLCIIREALRARHINPFYLDGQTPPGERITYTERFNHGEGDVFLISLKAGGTGLNLTGADMVIHYDPWWNPAVVDQASDRAYRIGQKRSVQVIKLAARNSIEEKILRLQAQKKAMAEDIITSDNISLKSLTAEEILSLFD